MAEFSWVLVAQSSNEGSSGFLMIAVALAVGFFLLSRPQRKRQRQLKELQQNLKVGDEVITSSGIYGFIAAEDDKCVWLLIDDEVEIRVARAAIHTLVPSEDDTDDDDAADDTDDDDAAGRASLAARVRESGDDPTSTEDNGDTVGDVDGNVVDADEVTSTTKSATKGKDAK